MTWRWKNIHFAAGDGGGDDGSKRADNAEREAAARKKAFEEFERYRESQKDVLDAAQARLKLAETLQEKAKAMNDLMAVTTDAHIKLLKAQKEEKMVTEMTAEAAEEWYQTQLKIYNAQLKQVETMTDLAGQTKSFASNWLMIDDNTDGFTQSLWRAKGDMGQMAVFGYQAASAIDSLLTPANIFQATVGEIVEGVSIMVMELESALPAFNATMGAAGRLNAEIVTATNEVRQYGVGMEAAAGATTSMASSLGNFNRMGTRTRTELVVMAAGLERLGISTETSANLVNSLTRSLGMTTDAAQASIKSVAAVAASLEMPVGKMVEAFDQALPRLAQFGKEAPEVFKKMAAAAKATGIEVGALMGMVGNYDTWEGSAEAAGRLNAMLGGPLLNSIDMLKASDEERVRMLIGSMEASGKSWEAMGRFERQAFASAAGISDMNEAGKLFSTTLSEYDWQQQEAAEAADNAEAYNDMIQAAVPLAEKWKQVYMKAWGALGPLITPVLGLLKDFADFLLEWNPWVLLVGGFTMWIGTMMILSHLAKRLAAELVGLATATVQAAIAGKTDNAVKKQGILMSALSGKMTIKEIALEKLYTINKILGANSARLGWMTKKMDIMYSIKSIGVRIKEIALKKLDNIWTAITTSKLWINTAAMASNNSARMGGLVGMLRTIGARGIEIGQYILQNAWLAIVTAGKAALAAVNWILFGSQTAVNAGQTAAGVSGVVGAAGTTAMGTASWFAVIPVGLLALGIGLLALGLGLMAIAVAAVVWAFVYLVKLFMESPQAAITAAVGLSFLGIALAVLAAGLALVTLVAFPASIALLLLGAASLRAAVGFGALAAAIIMLGAGMIILAVGTRMTSAAFAILIPQAPGLLLLAASAAVLAISFAALAVSLLMIASIAPALPLIVAVFTALAVVFTLISLSIALVATQMSNLMESMSELAGTGAVVTIGTSIKEVAEGINEASLVKTVALTGFMGATALAGAAGGAGGGGNEDLAAAVSELRQEVAATNALYKEIASQPIIIKVGDQPIKKLVNQGIGDKIIAAVRANASTAAGG